jgi:hypothetical protein
VAGEMVTNTCALWLSGTAPLTTAVTSLVPATVELRVPTATPSAPVGSVGCTRVLPLPVAERVTTAPGTGAPCSSLTVTRIIAVPPPTSIEEGSTDSVERLALTAVLPPPSSASPFATAVKVSCWPTPAATAVRLLGPGAPSVQIVEAYPEGSVIPDSGATLPLPVETIQVISRSGMPCPESSTRRTLTGSRRVAPGLPSWLLPPTIWSRAEASVAGAPSLGSTSSSPPQARVRTVMDAARLPRKCERIVS